MDSQDQLYRRIRTEIVRLNRDWNTFHELFAHSEERMTLLNNIAPGFFRITQDLLIESVFLVISRLTDPIKSAGKENLSFLSFAQNLDIVLTPPPFEGGGRPMLASVGGG